MFFSYLVNFIKQVSIMNFSRKLKSFKVIFFIWKFERIFQKKKTSTYFFVYLRPLTLFKLFGAIFFPYEFSIKTVSGTSQVATSTWQLRR